MGKWETGMDEERGDSSLRQVSGSLRSLTRPPLVCQGSAVHRIKIAYKRKVDMAVSSSTVSPTERRLKARDPRQAPRHQLGVWSGCAAAARHRRMMS